MKNDYLIRKKPMEALLIFSLPIIVGNLFQQTYTMVDSAIVGRYVGEEALAAVGASFSLTNIFVFVAIGGGMGASVVVSRYFGAKKYKEMKVAVFTAFLTFLVLSMLLGGIGFLFSERIMDLLNTPVEAMRMAVEYLNIYFLGLPFLFMYNVVSSMFNAFGKSRIPLCFLIFSSLLNIALDFVFVRIFHLGVAGVAWATLIAQGLSAVLSFAVFMLQLKQYEMGKTKCFDKYELRTMTKIALPSILQQSTVSIGMMLIQSVINGFGTEALAGYSAAMRVESLCIVPLQGIGNAMSSYTAQNIGANQNGRVVQGYRIANGMILVSSILILVGLQFFTKPIISFFLGEEGTKLAFQTGCDCLMFISWFLCILGFKMTADGVLRGAGDMKMFTIANLFNLTFRVSVSMICAPRFGIAFAWYAVPIGWFVNWLISYLQYRTGKWKRIYKKECNIRGNPVERVDE